MAVADEDSDVALEFCDNDCAIHGNDGLLEILEAFLCVCRLGTGDAHSKIGVERCL